MALLSVPAFLIPSIKLTSHSGNQPNQAVLSSLSVRLLKQQSSICRDGGRRRVAFRHVACASAEGVAAQALAGDEAFRPFEEVQRNELYVVPTSPHCSLARHLYADECEAAVNEQVNFFKRSSVQERVHAEKFMIYQNKRGGKVKLNAIVMPPMEFDHQEKGDALYAMELALSLEKLTNEKLLKLHDVAARNNDKELAEFVESEFLSEQVEAIKKISEIVAQLRMVGKGHGVWHFDQMLLHQMGAAH
ncbi:ferritin-3, chloroplastic-like isoform X2 [Nymphaea colorata]|uniref:ferritin-3, chloroplastic-like isoform X2 n=1 Tax=Nymphaea colorata TaxID=210225 RepID=UPI00214EBC78|nr:ferritin-3, chloroplastic-like isoform X2 [Nymphaea colorata]